MQKGTLLESGGLSGLLPLLKEEEDTAVSVEASAPLADPWEGGLHDEELANYWAPAAGDNSADCLSPDPQGTGLHHSDGQTDAQTLAQTQASQQLSQLRVLLEQNEGASLALAYIEPETTSIHCLDCHGMKFIFLCLRQNGRSGSFFSFILLELIYAYRHCHV